MAFSREIRLKFRNVPSPKSQPSRKSNPDRAPQAPPEPPENKHPERRLETDQTTLAPDPRIEELEQLVHEKNELLEVLTERLELAAEQLDRVRRQGGSLEPAAKNQPTPFDDPALTDDLRQMLTDWQDLRGRGYFGSLEERLDGIQGIVSQLRFEPARSSRPEEERPKSVAEILAKHGYDANSAVEERVSPEGSADAASTGSAESLQLPEPPPHLDIENGSTQELREGLQQREEYIVRLKDYLIAVDAANQLPSPPPDLGVLTADQKQAMESWEASIRKEIRQTQIQLWIERAQISREQMRISQMEHHLETETRRLGMTKQRSSGAPETPVTDPQKGKNWLGLFGNK
ncbi:MAG: hypothetical protein JWN70_2384 [Planctomycetaceae bacterium]|nr:hypothetical protein [Planctomycetaceae bacterium]